jgi:ribosome maturation factor RimP
MNGESQIQALEHKMEALLSTEPSFFLVEVRIKPINNIKVFIDGDQGISIDKLVRYNRGLYKHIEETQMFPNDDFSLEVSSPGLDEPLKLYRQYLKNIGREVEVTEKDGSKREGKLISATETEIVIEEMKGPATQGFQRPAGAGKNLPGRQAGKKKEWVTHTILFENIKTTKVQIKI